MHHHHRLDAGGAVEGVVGDLLEGDDPAAAVAAVAGHHHLGLHVVDAVAQRLGAEPREHDAVHGPDAGAREQGDGQLRGHRQVHRDPVALLDPEVAQGVREAVHVLVEVPVGEGAAVAGLALPDEGRLVAPGGADVPVDAVHAGVDLPAEEPLDGGRRPLAHGVPRAAPLELARELRPEPLVVAVGLLVDAGVVGVGLRRELGRRLEYPVFLQQRVESVSLGHGSPPGKSQRNVRPPCGRDAYSSRKSPRCRRGRPAGRDGRCPPSTASVRPAPAAPAGRCGGGPTPRPHRAGAPAPRPRRRPSGRSG